MFYKTLEKMSCLIPMCAELSSLSIGSKRLEKWRISGSERGTRHGIRDLTRNIVRDLGKGRIYWRDTGFDATWEAGFAKILARDVELQGKKVVFPGEMKGAGDAGFLEKVAGMRIAFNNLLFAFTCAVTRHLYMLTRDSGWANRSVRVGKKGESNQRM